MKDADLQLPPSEEDLEELRIACHNKLPKLSREMYLKLQSEGIFAQYGNGLAKPGLSAEGQTTPEVPNDTYATFDSGSLPEQTGDGDPRAWEGAEILDYAPDVLFDSEPQL